MQTKISKKPKLWFRCAI